MKTPKSLQILSIICSSIFLFFGWIWIYYIAVLFLPFALAGTWLWKKARTIELETSSVKSSLSKLSYYYNLAAYASSVLALLILLAFN